MIAFSNDGTVREDDKKDYSAVDNDEINFLFLDTNGMTKLEKEELNDILHAPNNEKANNDKAMSKKAPTHILSDSNAVKTNEGITEDKVSSLEVKETGEKVIEAAYYDPATTKESDTTDQTFNRGMTKTSNISNDNSTDDSFSKLFSKSSEKWDHDMK